MRDAVGKSGTRLVSVAAVFVGMCGFGGVLRSSSQAAQEPAAAALSGPQLFRERGCSHCHLLNGAGGRKGPDLSAVGRRLTVDAIRKQIREGGGAMPAYADALSASEIDTLTEMLHRQVKGR